MGYLSLMLFSPVRLRRWLPIAFIGPFIINGCAAYPDYKDGQELTCIAKKPYLSGQVNGLNGGMGNWNNDARTSSVHNIRVFHKFPDRAFLMAIAIFPDPQPAFETLELRAGGQAVRTVTKANAGRDDYLNGDEMIFEGRPYYKVTASLKDIREVLGTETAANIVALDGQGREIARERIELSFLDDAETEIKNMIAESQDMRDNRRSECQYFRVINMPIPESAPW